MFTLFGKKAKPLMNLIKYSPKDVRKVVDRINEGDTVEIPSSVFKDEQRNKHGSSTPLKDLNTILFIDNNAQLRIEQIDGEIQKMNTRIDKLKKERRILDAIATTVRIHTEE